MTVQEEKWKSEFGNAYTNRNPKTVEEMDELHIENKGITRTMFTKTFLDGLKTKNTLEVGCNVGVVLQMLNHIGFDNLYGIDVNEKAIKIAKENTIGKNVYVMKGSAQDIPFKDGFFDLVFTNGLLIHISPKNIAHVLDEIYRCSQKYIWGYEYYSKQYEKISYRDENGLLWKADFAQLFMERFGNLKLIKNKQVVYIQYPELIDTMFLLEKEADL